MYAVDVWKVEIITMSFGFKYSVPEIEKAIDYASAKRVLMFAAASNCGGNSRRTWPARLSEKVFCIYATTGLGNKYPRNPTEQKRAYNFAILGSSVLSWMPAQSQQKRKSGTSTATPIAAGIAAILIGFVRHPQYSQDVCQEDKELLERLGTVGGMSDVFDRMVGTDGTRDGYDYLCPWNILDASDQHKSALTMLHDIIRDLR
jgi:subtilisin family serine protease